MKTTGFLKVLLVGLAVSVAGCSESTGPGPIDPPAPPPLFDRIIFSRLNQADTGSHRLALYTMKPDGSDLRLLVDSLDWPESPVVSPSGHTVVFENWGRLYSVNSDGKNKREIVTGLGEQNFAPRWSPDGSWILFQGPDSLSGTTQIYRIRPDGGGLELLTDPSIGGAHTANWAPDGTRIVVVRYTETDCFCPYLFWATTIDLVTGIETTVVDSTIGFDGSSPSWSPDGKTVLFLGSHQQQWSIMRLDLPSGDYGFFADAKGNRPAIYSPDGSTLLYGTGDLWLMDADGQNQRPILADGMTNFEAFWTPASASP